MARATATKLLDRGVWEAEYLLAGRPVLLAITSRGECLKRVRLAVDDDEEIARAWLEGLLEHYDPPRATLSLMPAAAPSAAKRRLYLPLLRR